MVVMAGSQRPGRIEIGGLSGQSTLLVRSVTARVLVCGLVFLSVGFLLAEPQPTTPVAPVSKLGFEADGQAPTIGLVAQHRDAFRHGFTIVAVVFLGGWAIARGLVLPRQWSVAKVDVAAVWCRCPPVRGPPAVVPFVP